MNAVHFHGVLLLFILLSLSFSLFLLDCLYFCLLLTMECCLKFSKKKKFLFISLGYIFETFSDRKKKESISTNI